MKHLLRFSSLYLLCSILLASCSSAAHATVTSEATPSSTPTPPPTKTPTPRPEPPATAMPSALESGQGQALLGLGYEQAQLQEYKNFAEGTYSFPGDTVVYNGIIGTKVDGSKEMLAIKFSDNPNYLKLSSTEIMELANKACSSCFKDGYSGNNMEPSTEITMTSTGIAESIEKKDVNGKVVAITQSILMVTQDNKGNPRLIRYVVQLENGVNPNINLLQNVKLFKFGNNDESTTVHSLEELSKFLPKSTQINALVHLRVSNATQEGAVFFGNTYRADPTYFANLEVFLSSHGATQTEKNPVIILSSGTH